MQKRANIQLDWGREARTGVCEAVLAESKALAQMVDIVLATLERQERLFVTRLSADKAAELKNKFPTGFHYHPPSLTAVIGEGAPELAYMEGVSIVAAGTSDVQVAMEAAQTLRFNGYEARLIVDVGVAGLWRLIERLDEIRQSRVIIAVAGMEGALFSVLGGLIAAPVIAVPTSVGYGVSEGGKAALSSALASCSPGIVTVNIDNGFGAAVAATKILRLSGEGTS
ncbi:hypothetical protein SAMN04488523_10457 [Sulfitobacter brevis]|uniref:PurE domain-containing protein n=1 Tax=Sulfitobacter brevis TaxID=74348 RepID=A0A1I1WTP6_9RHOB|nr:nickel pincer cofactor biosynthesis protein LarB [Sulfitobacter brevis]SFD96460.1 hypothetical protein SAMN04488523_10457 [Sulfitobacter brevis]